MRITQKLPQFSKGAAVLLVTGREDAVVWWAEDGLLTELFRYQQDEHTYSKHQGRFTRSGGGKVLGISAPEEPVKAIAKKEFLQSLKQELKKNLVNKPFVHAYLFTPSYMIRDVKKVLPANVLKAMVFAHQGEYTKSHPFKLLEMIQGQAPHIVPTSTEAEKILRRRGAKR